MDTQQQNDYIKKLEKLLFFVREGKVPKEVLDLILSQEVDVNFKHSLLRNIIPSIISRLDNSVLDNLVNAQKFNPLKYEKIRDIINDN